MVTFCAVALTEKVMEECDDVVFKTVPVLKVTALTEGTKTRISTSRATTKKGVIISLRFFFGLSS